VRRALLRLALTLALLATALFVFSAWGVIGEWQEVRSEAGFSEALSDAFSRLAFGVIAGALVASPAIVLWLRRASIEPGTRRAHGAAACLIAATVVIGGAEGIFASELLRGSRDGQVGLIFLYPALLNPLFAMGVAAALRRGRKRPTTA
jgi:hypothetical protein